ncbi:MAG: HAMP domain-containing sensor histidine kinase [Clostridiales bacterium]
MWPRKSIKYKVFFFMGLVSTLFMLIFAISYLLFYDDFSHYQNKNMLSKAYYSIYEKSDDDFSNILYALKELDSRYGVKSAITTKDFTVAFDNSLESSPNKNSGIKLLPSPHFPNLKQGEPYFAVFSDASLSVDFLFLAGILKDGSILTLRTPMPMIEANSHYVGLFLLFAGALSFAFCMILAYFFSLRLSKPLVEINEIAKNMTALNFSDKYSGSLEDEVGQLGQSINSLSSQLENTIGKLQETNTRLEVEIAKERKIDEMRKNFIVNVSHELKTPLALVQGYAEGLQVNIRSSQEDRDFYCKVIIEESERMSKMVQQLLSLSKIEIGNILPEMEIVDIAIMVEKVCSKNQIILNNKRINLHKNIPSVLVEADLDMLERVLLNILSNAIHHTESGGEIIFRSASYNSCLDFGPDLDVVCPELAQNAKDVAAYEVEGKAVNEQTADRQYLLPDKLRIFCFNTGEHIADDDLENIWSSFYKADKARTRAYGGSGIGLSIVKAVLEAHNNLYGVANLWGGVEFWFDLDIYYDEEDDDDSYDL